jgi:hypothetical protein
VRWRWTVEEYYAADVAPPRTPGALAGRTVHATESSRDLEELVARQRVDIGDVVVRAWMPSDGSPPSDAERMGLR